MARLAGDESRRRPRLHPRPCAPAWGLRGNRRRHRCPAHWCGNDASVMTRPRLSSATPTFSSPRSVGVGTPADRDQHRHRPRSRCLSPPAAGSTVTLRPVFFLLHARHLGGKLEGHALLGEDALERLATLPGRCPGVMRSRNSTTVTSRAEPPPHRTQFQPDHAGAHHQQLLGHRASATARRWTTRSAFRRW